MSKKQTFESALNKLEEIIQEFEQGDLPLDAMIKRYEEGSNLAKYCISALENAEKKVKTLNLNNISDDDFQLEPTN